MHATIDRIPAATRRFTLALLRAMGRFGTGFVEFNRQQRRLATVQLSAEAYASFPGTPPDTYAEFLFRTSGPLRHEPSARARLGGESVH